MIWHTASDTYISTFRILLHGFHSFGGKEIRKRGYLLVVLGNKTMSRRSPWSISIQKPPGKPSSKKKMPLTCCVACFGLLQVVVSQTSKKLEIFI